MADKIVTGEYADNILGVSSGLPAKKCITGIELDNALELMPKGNAIISDSYYDVYAAIIRKENQEMFCLVENRSALQIHAISGYAQIEILENMHGGYYCIPNASGNQGVIIYLNKDIQPVVYRFAPRSDGGFDRKQFTPSKIYSTPPSPYIVGYQVDFNKDYDMSSNSFGYFYFVSC